MTQPPFSFPQRADSDPQETQEWQQALLSVVQNVGAERARFLLDELNTHAQRLGIGWQPARNTPYVNTIDLAQQPPFPGGEAALLLERRIASMVRWNALAMVVKANRNYGELGGHIASYASAADLFEVGFNHFFRGPTKTHQGDLVFFQPHSAPGEYARAYLEGRLSQEQLLWYRQEVKAAKQGQQGLTSYPHPWLMPDFWQSPTGSMGLGPINAIYQARFMRYVENRQLLPPNDRMVWGVFGDGEMDEPESVAGLTLAAREKLDNLVFVINCNLQRLDGPVRGNSSIVNELESLFHGAGWKVIKLLWSSDWDALFAADTEGELARVLGGTVDGQMQTLAANSGAYNRAHFFAQTPTLKALADRLSDEEIDRLRRGGHDMQKIYAAYEAAVQHKGQPVVILALTTKGWGMGDAGQGKMTTHQQKQLDTEQLRAYRDRFNLPLTDQQCDELAFYRPPKDSPEYQHLLQRRQQLGGFVPQRRAQLSVLPLPNLKDYGQFAFEQAGRSVSSTMVFVRLLTGLMKEERFGPRVVPIVADEARTFGMASLFKPFGIYAPFGQHYEPEDSGSLVAYHESTKGQILEEGITEAGALSSWTAAATSYSVHGLAMLPFYIFYSMFGFQRVGDLIWAAADQRARGFLIGATAGRTTLAGEGLQHQDGSSHLLAGTVPNCLAYDPAYGYELAVLLQEGLRRMFGEQEDVFYYITVYNERLEQRPMPEGVQEGICRGMYCLQAVPNAQVRLLASGTMVAEAEQAAELLAQHFSVAAELWSVTSFTELARDGAAVRAAQRLGQDTAQPYVTQQLQGSNAAVVAVTDFVRALPDSIRDYVPAPYEVLGTDGFGRSDTRSQLRDFFQIDARWIALAAARSLQPDISTERIDAYMQAVGLTA